MNNGKVIQMLSPENYIRKKARSLPIYECLVNPEWKERGLANVIVARSHTNGNITACFYLVDTFCLGVKDTFYLFNVTQSEYRKKLSSREELGSFNRISYELAHNIVYAGLEFAEEYEFKPHKDFTSITRFMLEEDTEDVELIEIECGRNGKPFFVRGPFDDQAKINKILAQLERTAGPGNYDFLTEDELNEEYGEEEEEYEEEEVEEDEFQYLSLDKKKDLFKELESKKAKPSEEDTLHHLKLALSIFNDFTDPDLVDKYYEDYVDDLNIPMQEDFVPDEMLGIRPGSMQISDELRSMFLDINDLVQKESKKASKLLDEFRKRTPDVPASYYLELNILNKKESGKYAHKLAEYAKKFPDYAFIRFLWLDHEFSTENIQPKLFRNRYNREYFFPGRTSLHVLELFNYLIFKIILISHVDDASHLEALYYSFDKIDFDEDTVKLLDSLVLMTKMQFVIKHLKN